MQSEKIGFILHEVTEDNILLCKIIKEYESIEQAKEGLIEVLTSEE